MATASLDSGAQSDNELLQARLARSQRSLAHTYPVAGNNLLNVESTEIPKVANSSKLLKALVAGGVRGIETVRRIKWMPHSTNTAQVVRDVCPPIDPSRCPSIHPFCGDSAREVYFHPLRTETTFSNTEHSAPNNLIPNTQRCVPVMYTT